MRRSWWPLMLSLLVLPALGQAATYYVATSGSDSAPCSQASPCRSINGGIAKLSSGDTLLIGPGHYHELLTTYRGVGSTPIPNGTAAAYTTLAAQQPGTVTVTLPPSGDIWTPVALSDSAAYIQIEGLVLDGQQHTTNGVDLGYSSHAIRLKDLVIHHTIAMGVEGGGTNHEFLNVSMHHIAWSDSGTTTCPSKTCGNPPGELCSGYCHPYYFYGSGHLIDGGTYSDIEGWVFHWYASTSVIRNTCVQNALVGAGLLGGGNTFYNNVITDTAIGVFMKSGETIVHNTIQGTVRTFGGEHFGIYQQSGSANVIQNNLLQQRQGHYIYLDGGGSLPSANVAGNRCDVVAPGCGGSLVSVALEGVPPQAGAASTTCTALPAPRPPPVPPRLPAPKNLRVRALP